MKEGWELKKLGEMCKFVRGPFGGSLKKNCFKPHGIAVYEQQHAIYNQFKDVRYFIDDSKFEEMERFEVFSGDLIMSCSGTMGKVAIVPEGIKRGIINQALLKLTPSKNLNVEYLKYWLESPSFQDGLSKYSKGVAIKNIASVKVLKEIEIQIPPLSEQKAIVAILDKAFATIDQAKANIEKNIENAKELFQSKLNEIFSQKGDGWESSKLREIADFKNGLNYSKSSNGETIKIVGVADFQNFFSVKFEDLNSVNIDGNLNKLYELKKGDILTVRSNGNPNLIGRCIVANEVKEKTSHSGFTIRIRPNTEIINSKYLCHLMKSSKLRNEMVDGGNGVNIKSLNQTILGDLEIVFPNEIEIQKQIAEKLSFFSKKSQKLSKIYESKFNELEELKKSLLQKAFAGDLT